MTNHFASHIPPSQRLTANLFILSAIILLAVMLRVHFLDWVTIDWDEDLYRAYAQDLLHGKMLYRDIWDHKPPAIFYLFALIEAIHPSIVFFRIVGIAWSIADGLLLYVIARRLWSLQAGRFAFIAWTVATCPHWGSQSNTELFFTLFSLLAVYVFVRVFLAGSVNPDGVHASGAELEIEQQNEDRTLTMLPLPICSPLPPLSPSPRLALSRSPTLPLLPSPTLRVPSSPAPSAVALLGIGIAAGIAFQFKPVTVADLAAIILTLIICLGTGKFRTTGWILAGFVFPSLAVLVYLSFHGLVKEWLYAVYWYNLLYVSEPIAETLSYGPRNLVEMLQENLPFFVTAAAGLVLVLMKEDRKRRWFFVLWLSLTFLSVALGLKFLKHYFLQWLAPLSLLAGFCLHQTKLGNSRLVRNAMLALFCGWVVSITVLQGFDLIRKIQNWRTEGFIYYDVSYRTAMFVNQRMQAKSVYVWRSPSLAIYFLTGKRPPTRFLFWRHLTRRPLPPWMEEEWRRDLEAAPPAVIINSDSFNLPASSVPFMQQFIAQRYRIVRKLDRLTIYELGGY